MTDARATTHATPPRGATAALVLADGAVFWGKGVGAAGTRVGEVCFNTSMTGYQEIITDPSYAGQIITFTFPHIGNVGTNLEDIETHRRRPRAAWCCAATSPSPANWRAAKHARRLAEEPQPAGHLPASTRARITRRIRDGGAPNGVRAPHAPRRQVRHRGLLRQGAQDWPGLDGMDLAIEVT